MRGADCEAIDTLRGADCAAIDTRRAGAWSGLQRQSTRRVERIAWQSTRVECVRGAIAYAIDTLRGADCAAIDTRDARCVERIARQSTRCVERIARQSTREMWERSPRAAERAAGEQPSDRAGLVFSSTCRAWTVGHWQPLCFARARRAIRRLGAIREGRERVGHARRPVHARSGVFRRD
jgi:hypothetical protein